jgi:hypothetical protein
LASWNTWKEAQKKVLTDLERRDTVDFEGRGIDWNGVRGIAQDCERWNALCKHSTPTGRRSLTK